MWDLMRLGGVFAACFGISLVLMYFVFYKNPFRGRMEKISAINKESTSGKSNYLVQVIEFLGRVGGPKDEERVSRTRMTLLKAGYRGGNSVALFFGSKTFLMLLFPIISWALISGFGDPANVRRMIFYVVVAAGIGFYLPELWIRSKTNKRKGQITEGFPDLLDLLVVCVEAGQGMDAALDRVGQEIETTNEALGQEFKLLNLEIRAGKSRKEALKNMADRTGLADVASLVTLMNQSEELGVSVSQTLRVHSDSMRTKRRMRAETIAGRIPVKLTIPLILFILPCLFAVIIGPGVIRMIRAFTRI